MTTVEAPVPVIEEHPVDDLDIPEMHSHLYRSPWLELEKRDFAICGIHINQDSHAAMHRAEGAPAIWQRPPGADTCPVCGAPICPGCLEGA